ncbi:hypothetical protein [Polyangium jinanense]|uniref:Uncharacterized protein n=1 Tax=Polyangium jinanense TaxID=2829994 RepID=A0A9X4ANP7_9BACT|nr:hypothetical protein [Polyangium jinanense]MDC3953761.1 hypothetical protein [Polyangium jinanense]MDC3979118.1 hypothetical protein [Polyangium jinanense]
MTERASTPEGPPELPEGVLAVRLGPGANCSSAGSAIDILFYGSVVVGALAVALTAALTPRERRESSDDDDRDANDASKNDTNESKDT